MKSSPRLLTFACLLCLLAVVGAGALWAQLEGADRGIAPVDSSTTLEITGIDVDVSAENAEAARYQGWQQAQAKGWRALWARTSGQPASAAPALSDAVLNALVSGIIVEQEQIGPTRYIARLGILFDRARTGELLGVGGVVRRSAPMLVIPVVLTGSSFQSFESRNEWQRAWARLRTGGGAIDYVRPTGSGIDPLLLNVAQTRRPGRGWWRMLLDQYGAADVVMPEVHLIRSYPGGPALATFNARHGPDGEILETFTLRAASSAAIPRMFDEGIRRLDRAYTRALNAGMLAPDPSLAFDDSGMIDAIAARIEAATRAGEVQAPLPPTAVSTAPVPVGAAVTYTVQVDTPAAADVTRAEIAVSRVRGVTSAITTSTALAGTSVMRVTFVGDPAALTAGLQAQGFTVTGAGANLRISLSSAE